MLLKQTYLRDKRSNKANGASGKETVQGEANFYFLGSYILRNHSFRSSYILINSNGLGLRKKIHKKSQHTRVNKVLPHAVLNPKGQSVRRERERVRDNEGSRSPILIILDPIFCREIIRQALYGWRTSVVRRAGLWWYHNDTPHFSNSEIWGENYFQIDDVQEREHHGRLPAIASCVK